ncbi:unnamed protein product [Prorocentrum cordatum]|uniref:Tc1-like transposase DDE domain-containing protein n=1 Tax=Prorocentrum cordatum TaxID=2364126 RepID=A0ABN9UTJ1_9DINO|nr:unnamed protein product [Polarella glacialis]
MGLTGAVQARRALVKLLVTAAAAYSVVVRLHRDSQDSEVIAAFRKVLRKAHPDKGGADEHAKQLNAAKERWDQAKKPRGRPKRAEQPEAPAGAAAADGAPGETFQDLIVREVSKKAYRIQSAGVLLTYFGVQGLPQWRQFLAHIVNRGDLVKAVKSVNPKRKKGPWSVLCDSESFLRAKVSNAAAKAAGVKPWKMPAKSPDLNPAERCWSWLRRKLRPMDLDDAAKKRPVPGKTAYRARVRSVAKSKKAQSAGAAQAKLMKRVCREVARKKGAATGF